MGLDLSTWEGRSSQEQEGSLGPGQADAQQEEEEEEGAKSEERASAAEPEAPAPVPADAAASVVVRERSRTLDEPSQKTTRAKRESRRMRELEQAKFSLELLKVRATGGGASPPSEERRWSLELVPFSSSSPPFRSPQGTPDSQSSKGSFELLDLDEEPPKAVEEALDSEELCSPPPEADVESGSWDAGHAQTDPLASPAAPHPPKMENYLPTFYVPESGDGADVSCRPAEEPRQKPEAAVLTSETVTRPLKERRESARRPVVVVISMQKESPPKERLHPPAEGRARESAPSPRKRTPAPAPAGPIPAPASANLASQTVIEKLARLNEEKEVRRRSQQRQNEKEMMEQIRQQKEALERQRLFFAQHERDMFEKQRGEALQKIQQSRHGERDRRAPRPGSLLPERERGAGPAPHARPHSDSAPQPSLLREQKAQPQLPPPPASAPRERRRLPAEGWAPKLTLESREGVASRARAANRKPANAPVRTSSLTDKPGNIFFSPKDKVTFAK